MDLGKAGLYLRRKQTKNEKLNLSCWVPEALPVSSPGHSVDWRENIESSISLSLHPLPWSPAAGYESPQFLNLNSGTHQSPRVGVLHCYPSTETGTTQTNPSKQIGMTLAIKEIEWCKKQQLGVVLLEIRWSGSMSWGIQPLCWQFSAHKWQRDHFSPLISIPRKGTSILGLQLYSVGVLY